MSQPVYCKQQELSGAWEQIIDKYHTNYPPCTQEQAFFVCLVADYYPLGESAGE